MLDIRAIREDAGRFRAGLARRNLGDAVDALLAADELRRDLTARVEDLRARQNRVSKEIGAASAEDKRSLIAEVGKVSAELKELEPALADAQRSLADLLAVTPNVPDESAPDGFTDEDAVEIRRHGAPPAFAFEPRDHVALGEALGVLDTERGARTSGSRFVYLLGDIVFVQIALMRHAMDVLAAHGFTPVIPPVLVREEAMFGTGFLPTDAVNIYRTEEDELYLVGTSEVPLAAFHMDEVLDAGSLPLRYAGWSTCFRKEAGSYGKDTRGILRVHQFDKIEMFSYVDPADAAAEHLRLLAWEKEMLAKVELPYRVIDVAAGDLGGSAARKYDCEAWVPTQGRYRELTSTSNCTTFQARRLRMRVRDADGVMPLATLNGTLATTRWIVAILENHQQADGSVVVPLALRPFLGGVEVLEPVAK